MKVLIVEDDPIVSIDLADKLGILGYSHYKVCDSVSSAKELLEEWAPDVVIVDIELGEGESGIQLGKWLDYRNIPYFYLSGKQDLSTFMSSTKTNARTNIEKPISLTTLRNTLHLTLENKDSFRLENSIFVAFKGGQRKIKVDDIACVKASRTYCEIMLLQEKKPIVVSMSMGKMIEEINAPEIVRIHKSHAVNVRHIEQRIGNLLYLFSQSEPLDIGASYRAVVNKILGSE